MKYLILNADDYGLTPGVSRGIRYAFLCGALSSTTAMMNLPGAARDVGFAGRDAPGLPIGLHLCLTVGSPITPPEKVPTLVDGAGHFPSRVEFLERLDSVSPEEAGREFRAQIEALLALDVTPDHLDSHHFVSYLSPEILEQTIRLAEEYHLGLRPPISCDGTVSDLFLGLPESVASFLEQSAGVMIRQASVPTADRLYLSLYDKTSTGKDLTKILNELPDGWNEIMCHPGFADSGLRDVNDYVEERGDELSLLTESGLPGLIASRGIYLSGYAQLNV
jgi:predicted glycoside hydrolase/deacetylase ChbG (UPF0249 family)